MNFVCQQSCISQLHELADHDRHSVLIEGVQGCGKTYLAKQYANMLGIADFQILEPTVQTIRDAIDSCCSLANRVVICIENLDKGVPAASYALLKFLEEPADNIYIVVTCQNIKKVPDTIVSRSVCVTTSPPIDSDIAEYAANKDTSAFKDIKCTDIWRCVRTFKQADMVLSMTSDQLDYFNSLKDLMQFNDSVSNIVWKLGHYSDNSETPLDLVIRYIVELSTSTHIQSCGIECIKDLESSRIAAHATLAKFAFECKYCE